MLVLVSAWQFTPLHALIYQGATRAIPEVLYQAAAIDGAGTVRQFFHITLPQLRNSIITSVILMVVGGLTTFDTVLILTQGGPGTDTAITAYYMYQKAFKGFDFERARPSRCCSSSSPRSSRWPWCGSRATTRWPTRRTVCDEPTVRNEPYHDHAARHDRAA